ncbi:MAG: hypothetical protein ABJN69_10390 [Hellea sp.]
MLNLGKSLTLCLAASALMLSACGKEAKPNLLKDIQVEMSSWRLTKNATDAYPNLPEEKAKKRYANDMMFNYFRKEENPEKRHLTAAMAYLGYAQMNTRARPAYCTKLRVDISAFKSRFESQHRAEDKAVDTILAKQSLTRDMIWEQNERMMMVNVKNDLLRAGGLHGSHAMCSDIKKKPQKYAQPFNFTKIMPVAAAQLRQAQAQAVTQHAELTAAPTLRK